MTKPRKAEWTKVTCAFCGKVFEQIPAAARVRIKASKSGNTFCSRHCSTKFRWVQARKIAGE